MLAEAKRAKKDGVFAADLTVKELLEVPTKLIYIIARNLREKAFH